MIFVKIVTGVDMQTNISIILNYEANYLFTLDKIIRAMLPTYVNTPVHRKNRRITSLMLYASMLF